MRPEHAVVGAWATANAGLALGQLAFRPPMALPVLLYLGAVGVVAMFGGTVLLAQRADREGTRLRQPRRARAAVLLGGGIAIGLTGLAFGWWFSLFAVYPLLLALWSAPGERLPPGTHPWPAVLDGSTPAGVPRFQHDGSSPGESVPVPPGHPGHGPPGRPPRASARARGALLTLVGIRALARAVGHAVRRFPR